MAHSGPPEQFTTPGLRLALGIGLGSGLRLGLGLDRVRTVMVQDGVVVTAEH